MSIDTSAKRASCIGIGLSSLRTGITPDGSGLQPAQRQHADFLYASLVAEVVGAPTVRRKVRFTNVVTPVAITNVKAPVHVRNVPTPVPVGEPE